MHRERLTYTTAGPSTPWLAAGALLSGVGTVLLGPLLPHITQQWHLADSGGGLLLFAKFTGAFLGGISVPRKLRYGVLSGTLLACVGFSLFGLSNGLITGFITLFISGIGLGWLIASTNILAGRRYTSHTGSALASINFFWSLGAVGVGLFVAAFLPKLGLRGLLLAVSAVFLVVAVGGHLRPSHTASSDTQVPDESTGGTARKILLYFGLLLFLYGGLETCLSGWLTTYTQRYTVGQQLLGGQSGTVLLWIGITAGRALSSAILRFVREGLVQRVTLLLAFILTSALAFTQQTVLFPLLCLLVGASLAPFFPATFAIYMHRGPSPRQAGTVLAVSGLGAAAFPWIMGILSTHSGSLRLAMVVPMALALILLLASIAPLQLSSVGENSEKLGV